MWLPAPLDHLRRLNDECVAGEEQADAPASKRRSGGQPGEDGRASWSTEEPSGTNLVNQVNIA